LPCDENFAIMQALSQDTFKYLNSNQSKSPI
jgi:hypothetical protein